MTGYSLRETKHARTKIAITTAFIDRLEKTGFEDISVREICQSLEISEGTFFNYFPAKNDIMHYYIHLMFLKIIWKAKNKVPQGENIALINAVFEEVTEELLRHDNIVYQLISFMAVQSQKPKVFALSRLEKEIYFPDCPGIEQMKDIRLDDFFEECLAGAVRSGELPKEVKVDDLLVFLLSMLGGTLLVAKFAANKDRNYYYRRQLELLWKALGVGRKKG